MDQRRGETRLRGAKRSGDPRYRGRTRGPTLVEVPTEVTRQARAWGVLGGCLSTVCVLAVTVEMVVVARAVFGDNGHPAVQLLGPFMLPMLAVGGLAIAATAAFAMASIIDACRRARGSAAIRAVMMLTCFLVMGPKTPGYIALFGIAVAINAVAWWLMAVQPRLDHPSTT